ncbi:MAG: flagellar protein FliS [Cellulosilyticum sp.]|nr:flagellar protein FliS [Cellulosilyticum sp.]
MITVANVVNASQGELLCITYEILLESIQQAVECQDNERYINKAIKVIQMLTEDLDFEIPLSHDLFRLYVYIQGLLVQRKNHEKIQEAYKLVNIIYQGYKQISENQESKVPSMTNAQQIYAGLTYGVNDLNEIDFSQTNRGFKA